MPKSIGLPGAADATAVRGKGGLLIPWIEIEVPSPLRDCISYCEVNCVLGCCGLEAVSTDAQLIMEWAHDVGAEAIRTALDQLDSLIRVLRDPSNVVSSGFLNHQTRNGPEKLLSFLEAFRGALQQSLGLS